MKYRVLVVATVGGWTEVEADSVDEAETKAEYRVTNEGAECIYKATHGEFDVVGEAEKL